MHHHFLVAFFDFILVTLYSTVMLKINFLLLFIETVRSFAINNTVTDLKVTCSEQGISVKIFPEKPLDRPGRIYVKGKSTDANCIKNISQGLSEFEYSVPIGGCNMERTANQRGSVITYHIVYVVSFHPIFLTKIDHAYRLTCSFGDVNNLLVTNFFSVSMIPTSEVPAQNLGTVNCSYSIHANDTIGPDLRYTRIGEKVVHVWKCDNLQSTQFMWVHDCTVSPEYGNGTNIIDGRGCTLDRVVIDQLQYPRMDIVIGHHHAYKFADYPTLLFKCSITICDTVQKSCPIIRAPPDCSNGFNDGAQGGKYKRSDQSETYQVTSEPLSVLSSNEEISSKYANSASETEVNASSDCPHQLIMMTTMVLITVIALCVQCIWFYKCRQ